MYLCNVIAKVSCVRHNQASLILLSLALPLHCICKGSECSAVGSALRSGRRGRAFESPHSDRKGEPNRLPFSVGMRLKPPFSLLRKRGHFVPLAALRDRGLTRNLVRSNTFEPNRLPFSVGMRLKPPFISGICCRRSGPVCGRPWRLGVGCSLSCRN